MKLKYAGRLLSDLLAFARQNKAWWLVPLVVMLLLGGLVIAAGQGAAPFIYTLF